MLCADRVPIVRAHFKSAMTQTGSPDPRIDLVCITSSCPRQFLQLQTPLSLPGLTSLTRSRFTQPHYSTLDAAERAPSTSSLADKRISQCNVRFTPKSGHVRCTSPCPLCANSGHCAPLSRTQECIVGFALSGERNALKSTF
jgi:hypothetical protein